MITITGYIARETDKAVAFVQQVLDVEQRPLWIPHSKIVRLTESDDFCGRVQLAGEGILRQATPVEIEIDAAFATKVGVGA